MASSTSEFRIRPRGPFSLARAVAFGFGPTFGTAPDPRPMMRLAFCLDGYGELAGVVLTEEKGVVVGRVSGESAVDTVKDQVARVLSLDFDGRGWEEVGARDPVIGELQAEFSGFRPVLFHSPYEAAAWAIIATRKPNAQARKIRETIARTLGQVFDLEGESVAAFPTPERLAALDSVPGGDTVRAERLRGVARAALEGVLHPQTLRDLGVERARQQVKTIPGIGDFYAGLIAHRAVGFPDALNENDESSWAASPTSTAAASRPRKTSSPWPRPGGRSATGRSSCCAKPAIAPASRSTRRGCRGAEMFARPKSVG